MNVRLDGRSIRFRCNAEEFDQLRTAHQLSGKTCFSNTLMISYAVHVIDHQEAVLSLTTHSSNGLQVTLNVSQHGIDALSASLPTKEGLRDQMAIENGDTMALMLEVDVRRAKSKQ